MRQTGGKVFFPSVLYFGVERQILINDRRENMAIRIVLEIIDTILVIIELNK